MIVRISVEHEDCTPYKKHKWDAGWDLKSNNNSFTLYKDAKVEIKTGVRIEIPPRFVGLIVPRSGLGIKHRVGLANTVGVIDSEYRGEIIVWTVNDGNENVKINRFDRFCQLLIVPVHISDLRVVNQLSESSRGDSGFGSTGGHNAL